VVKHIIAPGSGVPIEGRAPIPTEEERHAEREADRLAKLQRRGINKMVERAEKQLGVAELILRKARKELALRTRLMGIGGEGKEGGDAPVGEPQ
jgi:small subunit ribosomal protein S17